MSLIVAFKAFFRALREPAKAKKFIEDKHCGGCHSHKDGDKETASVSDNAHLRFLSILQQSARLIDFFKEDISSCNDAQVGAAVRKIHEECRKKLEELVTIRPIYEEAEGSRIQIPVGYDPLCIKVVGKVKGQPPYTGVLVHKGWKAHKRSLSKQIGHQNDVLYPAEVEVR